MRLIFGGELSPEDFAAIERGYDQRVLAAKIGAAILPVIENIGDALTATRLDALAWMVANGYLDIKVALKPNGMYHEKIGIFTDSEGDQVIFQGSANETKNALLPGFNFESINVFQSWRTELKDHYIPYVAGFENLWQNKTRHTVVIDFPEAARDRLIATAKRRKAPDRDLEVELQRRVQLTDAANDVIAALRVPGVLGDGRFELRPHQRDALNAWKSRAFSGILAMATGSGKTVTALYGATKLFERLGSLFVVVAVPYQALAEQWCDVVSGFGVQAIRCYGSAASWCEEMSSVVSSFQSGALKTAVCVVVNRTLQGDDFQSRLEQVPGESLLFVGDECHHHSTLKMVDALPKHARLRLGLSATPEHYWDGDSNERLRSYYGDVCYAYTLENALNDGVLTPYEYHLHVVELTGEETEQYIELSDQIAAAAGRASAASDVEYSSDDRVKRLLFQRARLLGSASQKLTRLRSLLAQQQPAPFTLFYCGDGSFIDSDPADAATARQVDAVSNCLDSLGWKVSHFTSRESREERLGILNGFRIGMIDALVAIRCLDEGIDVPDCRTAYILASSRNPRQFVQRRGRILRRSPGKTVATIHDFLVRIPSAVNSNFTLERSLIVSELKRASEFVSLAVNRADAYSAIEDLLREYDAAHHFV
jgi:superfamily II DNA or RNA helicase